MQTTDERRRRIPFPALVIAAVLLGLALAVAIDVIRTGGPGGWLRRHQVPVPYLATGQRFTVDGRTMYLDCRGQGGLSEDVGGVKGNTLRGHIIRGLDDAPEKLYYRQVFLDTAQLARIVMAMPDVDPDRVGATGPRCLGRSGGRGALAPSNSRPRAGAPRANARR